MLFVLCAALAVPLVALDTTVSFGVVKRDLTGDTIPEVLTLKATGRTVDTLQVTFTIESSGQIRFSRSWRLTRASFDPRRRLSDAEFRTRLSEYGNWFFGDTKFMAPARFLANLRSSARLHIARIPEVISRQGGPDSTRARMIWEQMQAAGITVFQFSPGGDAIMSIGWSATDNRFYNLLECC